MSDTPSHDIAEWVAAGPPDSHGRSIISVALAKEVIKLRSENALLRCVCDAAFTVVRDDGEEDGWTAWQELVSTLEDARYKPRVDYSIAATMDQTVVDE